MTWVAVLLAMNLVLWLMVAVAEVASWREIRLRRQRVDALLSALEHPSQARLGARALHPCQCGWCLLADGVSALDGVTRHGLDRCQPTLEEL